MAEPPGPHDPTGIVINALRVACPSFEPAWAEHIGYWANEPEARGSYLDMGAFAHHVVAQLTRGETTEFDATFTTIERLYRSVDAGGRYLLTVGLLESIQNIASHIGPSLADRFRPWLGPITTVEWDKVNQL